MTPAEMVRCALAEVGLGHVEVVEYPEPPPTTNRPLKIPSAISTTRRRDRLTHIHEHSQHADTSHAPDPSSTK